MATLKQIRFEEWSRRLNEEAGSIKEEEINETFRLLENGDYSCIGSGVTNEKARKLLDEVADGADKMLKEAAELDRQKEKRPPDKET